MVEAGPVFSLAGKSPGKTHESQEGTTELEYCHRTQDVVTLDIVKATPIRCYQQYAPCIVLSCPPAGILCLHLSDWHAVVGSCLGRRCSSCILGMQCSSRAAFSCLFFGTQPSMPMCSSPSRRVRWC